MPSLVLFLDEVSIVDSSPSIVAVTSFDPFGSMTLTAGESSFSESHTACFESLTGSTRHFPTFVGIMCTESSVEAIAGIDLLSLSASADLDNICASYQR